MTAVRAVVVALYLGAVLTTVLAPARWAVRGTLVAASIHVASAIGLLTVDRYEFAGVQVAAALLLLALAWILARAEV